MKTPAQLAAAEHVELKHFTKRGMWPRGILHIGANNGFEAEWYLKMGVERVILFEPLPSAFRILVEKFENDDRISLCNVALGERNEPATLNVTAGDGMGSSFLRELNPDVQPVVSSRTCHIARFDQIADMFDLRDIDTLVVDVQGMELQVLRGFGHYLQRMSYLNIECSRQPLYEGSHSAVEVIEYLSALGFVQESPISEHGDIMFCAQSKLKPQPQLVQPSQELIA